MRGGPSAPQLPGAPAGATLIFRAVLAIARAPLGNQRGRHQAAGSTFPVGPRRRLHSARFDPAGGRKPRGRGDAVRPDPFRFRSPTHRAAFGRCPARQNPRGSTVGPARGGWAAGFLPPPLAAGSSSKLGLHGATPTAQRANVNQAPATDLASVIALANELRAALVEKGLIRGTV